MLRYVPYILICIPLLFSRCAQQTTLGGGEKDTTPPQLDSTKQVIPANGTLNFSATRITIPLNEYIKLKDKEKQVLITPFLEVDPDIYVKGKKVIVDFKSPLASNTTYILNFGKSIVDITEGNEMVNFKYVFSTGSYIDSLSYKAVVYDAFEKTPIQGAYVMLYKNHSDSVIFKEKPNYFGITDASGRCLIENIGEGTYKVVSFLEETNNYKWDPVKENIGFSEKLFNAGHDSIPDTLLLFKDYIEELKLEDVTISSNGKGLILFNQPLSQNFQPENDSLIRTFAYEKGIRLSNGRDSLSFFVNPNFKSGEKYSFGLTQLSPRKVLIPLKEDTLLHFKTNAEIGLKPGQDLDFVFSQPLTQTDASKIELRKNDQEIAYELVQTDYNRISIASDWIQGEDYQVIIYPGAVTSYRGLNNDTITAYFSVHKENEFGQLITNFILPDGSYIIELLNSGKVLQRTLMEGSAFSKTYRLIPGNYRFRIIFDLNDNGIWDSGDYFKHLDPERVEYYADPIQIKKGWDMDIKWEIKN